MEKVNGLKLNSLGEGQIFFLSGSPAEALAGTAGLRSNICQVTPVYARNGTEYEFKFC